MYRRQFSSSATLWPTIPCFSGCDIYVLQITEELEKVKQEMEEKGSSMSDGGEKLLMIILQNQLGLL